MRGTTKQLLTDSSLSGWAAARLGVARLVVIIVTGYRNEIVAYRCDPDAGRLSLAYFVAALDYSWTRSCDSPMLPS